MASMQLRASAEQGDVKDLLKVIGDLKRQLEDRKQACVKLKTENQRFEKEKKDLEKQLLALQSGRVTAGGMSAKQRALQRAVAEQQRQLRAQAMAAARSSEDAGAAGSRLAGLQDQVAGLEEEVQSVRAERDAAREETEQLRDKLAKQVAGREREMGTLRKELEAGVQGKTQQELEASRAEAERLRAEATGTAETLRRREAEVQQLESRLQELRLPNSAGQQQQETSTGEADSAERAAAAVGGGLPAGGSGLPLAAPHAGGAVSGANGAAEAVAQAGPTLLAPIETAAAAVRAAVVALVSCPRGGEELPDGVLDLEREACDRISDADVAVRGALTQCRSATSPGTPGREMACLMTSEQLLALQRMVSQAFTGMLEMAGAALDGAAYAGNSFKPGKARDTWSVHLEDLCSSIYMCMRGVEQHMNAEIASMVAGLRASSRQYVGSFDASTWESKFLGDCIQGMLQEWSDAVAAAAPTVSEALEAARQRVEDASHTNAELKAIQALVHEQSLQVAAVLHIRRSSVMKAALSEAQSFGVASLVNQMVAAMAEGHAIAETWCKACLKVPPASNESAQAWQAVSLRSRRCLAMEAFKWLGHLADIASDALLLSGGRAAAFKIVMASGQRFMGEIFSCAGNEVSDINAPGAPLSGSDEAEYESKAAISAAKADFVEAMSLVDRRAMQILMTSVGLSKSSPPAGHAHAATRVSPASIGAMRSVVVRRVAMNLRQGHMPEDSIRSQAILLQRTSVAKNVLLVIDPKPYAGMAPTPEEKELDERNKKTIQAVRRVAAKLRWEVRNIKDIERLADEGIDEHGLLDIFDLIIKPKAPAGVALHTGSEVADGEGQEIVEALVLAGVPVHEITLEDMLAAVEQNDGTEYAEQMLTLAVEGRLLGPEERHSEWDAGVFMSGADADEIESSAAAMDSAVREAHTAFQSLVSSSPIESARAVTALEKEVVGALDSASRSWSGTLQAVRNMRCSELPSLAHSAEELFAGLGQLHEPRSPIKHAHQDDPRSGDRACADGAAIERIQLPPEDTAAAAGRFNRYAESVASTVSEDEEQGVSAVLQGRKTSFTNAPDEDDDDTVTQSFDEMSRDFSQ